MPAGSQPSRVMRELTEDVRRELLRYGTFPARCLLKGTKGLIVVSLDNLPTQDREVQLFMVGARLAREQSAATGELEYVFTSALAWMTPLKPGERLPSSPSAHGPRRMEIFTTILYHLKTNQIETLLYKVTRDKNDKLIGVVPMTEGVDGLKIHDKRPHIIETLLRGWRTGVSEA